MRFNVLHSVVRAIALIALTAASTVVIAQSSSHKSAAPFVVQPSGPSREGRTPPPLKLHARQGIDARFQRVDDVLLDSAEPKGVPPKYSVSVATPGKPIHVTAGCMQIATKGHYIEHDPDGGYLVPQDLGMPGMKMSPR